MDNSDLEMPEVVVFNSEGIECRAFCAFGAQFGLNMRTCQINFSERPLVDILYLPHAARVRLNDGKIWFDTDNDSAAAIEALFETGIAPKVPSR